MSSLLKLGEGFPECWKERWRISPANPAPRETIETRAFVFYD